MTRVDRRNLRNGLLFVAPYILGFLVLEVYPLLSTVKYSLQEYNVVQPAVWFGLGNYYRLLHDDIFWKALWNTMYFAIGSVPLGLILALLLAMLLSVKARGQAVYRTIFFLPTIVPIIVSAVLWLWVLDAQSGLLNSVLRDYLHFSDLPGWFADESWTKPAFIMMSLWSIGTAMVIFIAGIAEVPQSLYEVAEIDGAGAFSKFRHVTLPMVSPVILYNLVMGIINAFQYFTQPYVMTRGRGDPNNAAMFYALYLYRNSFNYLQMGYASAMAWIMFLVILGATLFVLYSSKRWVYYLGE